MMAHLRRASSPIQRQVQTLLVQVCQKQELLHVRHTTARNFGRVPIGRSALEKPPAPSRIAEPCALCGCLSGCLWLCQVFSQRTGTRLWLADSVFLCALLLVPRKKWWL